MFFTKGEKNLSELEKSAGATLSLAASTVLVTSATIGAATSAVFGASTLPPSVSIIAMV